MSERIGDEEQTVGPIADSFGEERQISLQHEELNAFLFAGEAEDNPADSVKANLTPAKFVALLSVTLDRYDDPKIVEALRRFAGFSPVEFDEPLTPEEDLSPLAIRVEGELSNFIERNSLITAFELLSKIELAQLFEMYNLNNLLAFAKELVARSPEGLKSEHVEMIYRYRAVLKRLVARKEAIGSAGSASRAGASPKTRDGARTWAGDVHPYGYAAGVIDPIEYRDFSDDKDDNGHTAVWIDGVKVKISGTEKFG